MSFHRKTVVVTGGASGIGRAICEAFAARGARVVVLSGTPGSSSGNDRLKGVRDTLAAAGPTYRIVSEQTANWRRAEGLTVTEAVLTTLGRELPDVILAANDDMALGASEAVRSMRIEDKGIKVLGFDGNQDAVNAVKAGEMVASVLQPIVTGTTLAVKQADTFLKTGKTGAATEKQAIDCVLVTKDNADTFNNFVITQ